MKVGVNFSFTLTGLKNDWGRYDKSNMIQLLNIKNKYDFQGKKFKAFKKCIVLKTPKQNINQNIQNL